MKTRGIILVLVLGLMICAFGQKATMELTFTAENNGQYIPLDSIFIENLSQGGDTTLYAPDTVLVLDYITSIGDNEAISENSFSVTQNFPNPFKGKTEVNLYLPQKEHIKITVWDVIGNELTSYEKTLIRGSHSFAFYSGNQKYYLLTVTGSQSTQAIKMLNAGSYSANGENCKIVYIGNKGDVVGFKTLKAKTGFVFDFGDGLRYTAYSVLGDEWIFDVPTGNQNYTFQFTGGLPCPGMPTITDIDGNEYNTVQIGNQCWMKENLKTTNYKNGTPITNVTNGSSWGNLTTGAYAWYDNDISWKDSYGAIYNWYATVDSNKLCPTGWHVSTNDEWTALTDLIGGTGPPHGNELKSCRQVNSLQGGGCNTADHPRWNANYENGTDDYGFSALPGGSRYLNGDFNYVGMFGTWWSSTEYSSTKAWFNILFYSEGGVTVGSYNKQFGLSVRCLRDESGIEPTSEFIGVPTIGLAPLTVNFTDQSINNPTGWQWIFGDGGTSTEQNPEYTYDNEGLYTVSLIATNEYGSDTAVKADYITVSIPGGPCPGMPTITDIDDNEYSTVLIGTQCWMKENLKTITYSNGTPIPNVTDPDEWENLTTGAYVWYDNDISWKASYGALYNRFTTVDTSGLCPTGWHVPTLYEWMDLTDFIGGTGSPHGNELKSCRQVNSPLGGECNTADHPRWNQSNENGTDDYGFSGLPGGNRYSNGTFNSIGLYSIWWSSTFYSTSCWSCLMSNNLDVISFQGYDGQQGYSIRCLRD